MGERKVSILEFHLHTDNNEFEIGSDLRKVLGGKLTGGEEGEGLADLDLGESEAVEDVDEAESGGKKGPGIVGLLVLLLVVFAVRKYMSGDDEFDEFEDEFET